MDSARGKSKRIRLIIVVAAIAGLLIGLRAAMPYAIKRYVNRELASMGDYRGHVADIELLLWQGGYALRDVRIVKIASKKETPFANFLLSVGHKYGVEQDKFGLSTGTVEI